MGTTNPHLRRASNYLLFSLAIADLIVTLVCEPLFIGDIIQRTFLYDCKADLYYRLSILSYISCASSVLHMAAISVDRFLAVAFPLRHKNFMENWGLKVMLTVSWSIPVFKGILVHVLWHVIPLLSYRASQYLLSGTFFVSFFLILFFYFLIVVFLLRYKRKREQLCAARNVSVRLTSRIEVRVTCTLAIAIGIFTACWAPGFAVSIFARMDKKLFIRPKTPLGMWIATLALSNSAMNFLIYSAKILDFREAYVSIIRKMLRL